MAIRQITNTVLASCLAIAALRAADSNGDSPKELALAFAQKGRKAEKAGQNAEAYLDYARAAALQPANRSYKAHMELLQSRAAKQSKPSPSPTPAPLPEPAPVLAMDDVFDSLTAKELAQARELNEVPSLHAKPGTLDFDLSAEPRALFDKVAERFGLQTVYDGDYPKTGTPIRFRVSGADYRDALHALEAATASFVIPLSPRLFMVAQDTPAKRNDLEQTMEIAIPVPQAMTTQELTEMGQILRQATGVEKLAWESAQSRIVLKDRVSRVMPAIALMNQLTAYRPEVMIDLEFLQVSLSDMLNYGFTVTNSFSAIYLGQILNNALSVPSGVTNLLSFGGGKTLIGLTAAEVQAMFSENRTEGRSVYNAQLRSVSGQPATIHVGEKYPIITSQFVGTVTPGTGTVYSPPPSFTFEDLGLELKVTPVVNGADTTSLAVETAFKVLTGDSVNSIPVIGNRSLKSQISVTNGQWALIGTMLSASHSKTRAGFWGLSQIPYLGQLFTQTSVDNEDSEVLIGMRTRLLSLPPGEKVLKAMRMGSDSRPYSPL